MPRCGACSGWSWLRSRATLLLRTGILHSGYWIDEAITVGIASHGVGEIPGLLRLDGSPPLFYLLLHGWMAVAGTSEAATRALPLLFALLAVPVSYWAGSAAFGRRAGALAAAGAAGCPFLTYYAQETRMYSMVAVLSVLASASFVLAFVHGRRRHVWLLGLWLVLLLYAHNWALFLVAGMGAAWLWLWHEGRVEARDGALLAAGVALAYAPWVPSLLFQAGHTAAPWSSRPTPLSLLAIPGVLFGFVAVPLLALGAGAALQRARPAEGTRLLALIGGVAALLAFLGSQLEPAWAPRYLAILFGPLLLALAAVLARGARWTWVPLLGVARHLARLRSGAGQEQRAHGGEHGDAGAAAGRPRGLLAARAGAGARPLPPAGPALRDAARPGRRAAGDRLA